MRFIWKLVLSRVRRQKIRLLLTLLAIAASSCLIVWTIGGYQSLFVDATIQNDDLLGQYDVRIAKTESNENERQRGTPTFGAPFFKKEQTKSDEKGAPQNETSGKPDKQNAEKGRGGERRGVKDVTRELIERLRDDESVVWCDETAPLSMFVYSLELERSILEDQDAIPEDMKPTVKRTLELTDKEFAAIGDVPDGVDPKLHRHAFAAFRATMGTPMNLGSTFVATTATEAPFDLKEGRWFQIEPESDGVRPREAVMTRRGAERFHVKIGDPILLIDQQKKTKETNEFQLTVVGIVDDPELDGFYVSRALAEECVDAARVTTKSLFLKVKGNVDKFCARWNDEFTHNGSDIEALSERALRDRRAATFKASQTLKYQAITGALLAALASFMIVFTALNMSVDEQKRLIAFYRVAGLTRAQVGKSILIEAFLLATPGWILGMAVGWFLVWFYLDKTTGLNFHTVGFSFLCTFVGSIVASLYPIFQSARVKPLDAVAVRASRYLTRERDRRQTIWFVALAVLGALLISCDLALVHLAPGEPFERAALHSGVGVMFLIAGNICLIPLAIRLTELVFVPSLAFLLRFDRRTTRRELSGNAWRVFAVSVMLSVGGGLFVTMQIWGYSMLEPFLLERTTPDVFVAFFPDGLRPELVDELKNASDVDEQKFVSIAVEQAAFAEGSVTVDPRKKQFANVVFFGVDVEKAFEGKDPLVGLRFREGSPKKAFDAMKRGRGVVVTDSLIADYSLHVGDTLKVVHPREPEKIVEYPVVGVVSFNGWQWLSKTSGVRRNFGRSGGLVFANEQTIVDDYQLERSSYFWFDWKEGAARDDKGMEAVCDFLARKNRKLDRENAETNAAKKDSKKGAKKGSNVAYAKLSSRESLTASIQSRAKSVIWELSKIPLTTLIVASIAIIGAIANSVRARRWLIGVERAVGVTRAAVVRMILVEAFMIGVVASIASFTFGALAAHGALKLGQSVFGSLDPMLILPWKELSIGFGLTVALCLGAALYPAVSTAATEILKLLKAGRSVE